MSLEKNKKNIKFEELYDVSDWEIETPNGWKNIESVGKTIPYSVWELKTKNGLTIEGADEHILFNENGNEKFLKDFLSGDKIQTKDGLDEVQYIYTNIQNKYHKENMYDIQVDGHIYYLANGIKSHNTTALMNTALQLIKTGCNVLYVTAEDDENSISERIDGNLIDVNTEQLPLFSKNKYKTKLEEIRKLSEGRLFIKEYPTSFANVNHIRALLDELEIKSDFKPDFIIFDYLNIFTSIRYKNIGDTYNYVKAISEEFRGLAVEKNIGIWTATQTNRTSYNDSELDLTSTSESFGLPMVADFMVAIIENDNLKIEGKYLFKILKSRKYGKVDPRTCKWLMGVNKDKQQIYELTNPREGIAIDDTATQNNNSNNSINNNVNNNKFKSVKTNWNFGGN